MGSVPLVDGRGYGAEPGWRRRRPSDVAAQARAARDAAGDAFYRMDRAQRYLRVRVDAYANLDAGSPGARRVQADFEGVNARAEHVAARYIATLDAHEVEDHVPVAALDAATAALTEATRELDAVAVELEEFGQRFAEALARVERALEELAPRAAAATQELAAARAALAKARADGLTSQAAGDALAAAEAAAATLEQGAAGLGVGGALRAADELRVLAQRARTLAEELPRRRAETVRRLVSLRTRRDALDYRAGTIADELRQLRRGFVESSWHDVADAEKRVAQGLQAATDALAEADKSVAKGDWDAAVSATQRVAAALDSVDARITAVTQRRATLEEVKADPSARLSAVRFQVRDAQRLVMIGRSLPPAPWANQLDALAARLDAALLGLDRPHPDYQAFLTELAAVSSATADLVARFRAAT